jgi:hypothetical protein
MADGLRALGEWAGLAERLHRQMLSTAAPGNRTRQKKTEADQLALEVVMLKQAITIPEIGREATPRKLRKFVKVRREIMLKALHP